MPLPFRRLVSRLILISFLFQSLWPSVVFSATGIATTRSSYKEDTSNNLENKNYPNIKELPKVKEQFIKIGSTRDDVASVQGTPKKIQKYYIWEIWTFKDGSNIIFEKGCVSEWDNYGALKVKIKNESQLPPNQKPATLSKTKTAVKEFTKKNFHPFTIAENGSIKGEISLKTGKQKNTHVRGYYRKDGTYVRGHYRS